MRASAAAVDADRDDPEQSSSARAATRAAAAYRAVAAAVVVLVARSNPRATICNRQFFSPRTMCGVGCNASGLSGDDETQIDTENNRFEHRFDDDNNARAHDALKENKGIFYRILLKQSEAKTIKTKKTKTMLCFEGSVTSIESCDRVVTLLAFNVIESNCTNTNDETNISVKKVCCAVQRIRCRAIEDTHRQLRKVRREISSQHQNSKYFRYRIAAISAHASSFLLF